MRAANYFVRSIHKARLNYPPLLAGALTSVIAFPSSAAVLEEVMVVAQKRQESMQDVGVSITAFSGDQMKALGINNAADLVMHTPGLNAVSPFGAGSNVAFSLRGVGLNDFSESNEAPVAVYVDGVYPPCQDRCRA